MAIYIVFDVETPNRANNRMSAIGISAIKDNKIAANYFSLVDPEKHISITSIRSSRALMQRKSRALRILRSFGR